MDLCVRLELRGRRATTQVPTQPSVASAFWVKRRGAAHLMQKSSGPVSDIGLDDRGAKHAIRQRSQINGRLEPLCEVIRDGAGQSFVGDAHHAASARLIQPIGVERCDPPCKKAARRVRSSSADHEIVMGHRHNSRDLLALLGVYCTFRGAMYRG